MLVNLTIAFAVEGIGPLAKLALIGVVEMAGTTGTLERDRVQGLRKFMCCSADEHRAAMDELLAAGFLLPLDDRSWMLDPGIFDVHGVGEDLD